MNVPTLPVRIGTVLAQLDIGEDDARQPFSLNINLAVFDALRQAGVPRKHARTSACRGAPAWPA